MRAYFIGYKNGPTANIVSCSWLFLRTPWSFFYRNAEEGAQLRRTNVLGINVTPPGIATASLGQAKVLPPMHNGFHFGGGSKRADKRRCLNQQSWHSVTTLQLRYGSLEYNTRHACRVKCRMALHTDHGMPTENSVPLQKLQLDPEQRGDSPGGRRSIIEQRYICNHICKDFKQFSYSISGWARVVSVSSHDDGQTSPLPLDASVFLVKTTANPGPAQ
jgi:hypothetical protein